MRQLQGVQVWESPRPNDDRLEATVDAAAPAELRLVMECHEEAVSPQGPQPTVTLVVAAMSAYG